MGANSGPSPLYEEGEANFACRQRVLGDNHTNVIKATVLPGQTNSGKRALWMSVRHRRQGG